MPKKIRNRNNKVVNQDKKYESKRKKSLLHTIIALIFIILTFKLHWLFILPAIFFLYLGHNGAHADNFVKRWNKEGGFH